MRSIAPVLILLAGAGLLTMVALVARARPHGPAKPPAESVDPAAFIESRPVLSELAPDKPLRLAVAGQFEDLQSGSVRKLFYTSQGVYTGRVTKEAVETLLTRNRADALEHRLAPLAAERLRGALTGFDQALRDLSLLIDEDDERAKQQLRNRPDRSIRLQRPRERDPRYSDLLVARAQMGEGRRGVVWGLNDGPSEVHVIVRWDEWPALAAMHQDRFHMLHERTERVRAWIRTEYGERGLSVFDQTPPASKATAGSPAANAIKLPGGRWDPSAGSV
jgi:hypothetical protein